MLTVRGQQHWFLTHERMFLWKCQSFWDGKCLDLGGGGEGGGVRTPNLLIHAECSSHLSYQGQLSHVFLILALAAITEYIAQVDTQVIINLQIGTGLSFRYVPFCITNE